MGRSFKIFSGILAVIVIVFVGFAVIVYSNTDSILKGAVEKYGLQYAGVSVTLNKLELAPENGQAELSGLIVGNPPGYRTDEAFKFGSISMNIDLGSITGDTILIRSIMIDEPHFTYEYGDRGSNIEVISKNVEEAASGGRSSEPKSGSGSGKKMIIESLVISNGRLSISHPLLQGKKIGSRLPTIRLRDIGKDKKDGAGAAEVVDELMNELEKGISAAVSATDVNSIVKGQTADVGDAAKGAE